MLTKVGKLKWIHKSKCWWIRLKYKSLNNKCKACLRFMLLLVEPIKSLFSGFSALIIYFQNLFKKLIVSFVSWRQHSNIHHYFCLQRCVQYCTLSLEHFGVHFITWCKVSMLTFSRFYVHFTIHYLLATLYYNRGLINWFW